MTAGTQSQEKTRSRWIACLTLAVAMAVTLTMMGVEAALPAEPAESDTPVFESADYDIKDGTGPAIAGGVAYLFAGDDPWAPPVVNSKIVALDASDGHLLWQKDLEWAGGMGSKARPLIDGNRLYIGCGEHVYCLDTNNSGNILWKEKITPDPPGDTLGPSTIVSDPVIYTDAGSNKVVVVGDFTYGDYVGVGVETGIKWRYALDEGSSASGAPGVDDADNRLYLPQSTAYGYSTNGKVHCVDVSGAPAKKWAYATAYDVAGSIACDQGKIYLSDFAYGGPTSNLYCLEDNGDQVGLNWKEPMWGSSGLPLVDTNRKTIYICGNDYSDGDNHFYAFDMSSGDLLWDNPNWGAYNGNCTLSPATGYLYVGSFDTAMWAHNKGMAAVEQDTGSELWYVQQKAGGDPVVSGGLVYSTAGGRLYAYEEFIPPSTFDWFFAEGYTGPGFEEWLCLANPGGPGDDAVASVTYLFNGEREPLTVDYPVPAGTRNTIDVKGAVGPDTEVSIKVVSDKPIVAERPMYFDYGGMGGHGWEGGHCVAGADQPLDVWYFAEGYTGPGFEEWLCLANFGDQPAAVTVDFLFADGDPLQKEYYVPGNRRVTFSVNEEAGYDRDVSMEVHSERPIVAERPMYFDYGVMGGHGWEGGHCVIGAERTSKKWYFAEGYTGDGFEEWLTLANPNDTDAAVDVTYLYQSEDALTASYVVPANTRRTISVNQDAGNGKELGMAVSTDLPILAERPMYFSYGGAWEGGHCVAGAGLPSNYWSLAEGYTDPDFDEYICISNPGKETAEVTVIPLFAGSGGEEGTYEVEPGRRFTLALKSTSPVERAYAISSNRGVVVERTMYFHYMGLGGRGWNGGHCTMGATLKDIY